MALDTQTVDFNATFLIVGQSLEFPLNNSIDNYNDAREETLNAAIKRVDLDDDDDDDDEEDDNDEEDEYEDDEEDEDDELDEDDEDEDEDEDEEELNLI